MFAAVLTFYILAFTLPPEVDTMSLPQEHLVRKDVDIKAVRLFINGRLRR